MQSTCKKDLISDMNLRFTGLILSSSLALLPVFSSAQATVTPAETTVTVGPGSGEGVATAPVTVIIVPVNPIVIQLGVPSRLTTTI
mgnify:CR=1 FL=1